MTGEIGREGITVMPVGLDSLTMPPTLADKLSIWMAPARLRRSSRTSSTGGPPHARHDRRLALERTGPSVTAHGSRSVTPLPLAKSSGTDA